MTSAGAALPVGTGMRGPPLAHARDKETPVTSVPVTIQIAPFAHPRSQEPLPTGIASRTDIPIVAQIMAQSGHWAGKVRGAMYEDSPYVPIEPQEPV